LRFTGKLILSFTNVDTDKTIVRNVGGCISRPANLTGHFASDLSAESITVSGVVEDACAPLA
jgi:hypothetical protein